MVNPDGLLG